MSQCAQPKTQSPVNEKTKKNYINKVQSSVLKQKYVNDTMSKQKNLARSVKHNTAALLHTSIQAGLPKN